MSSALIPQKTFLYTGHEDEEIPKDVTHVEVHSSVTSIGDCAFIDCKSLISITLPSSVTSIGKEAFYNCSSLAFIALPSSITSIGSGAFDGCNFLIEASKQNNLDLETFLRKRFESFPLHALCSEIKASPEDVLSSKRGQACCNEAG